MKDIASIDPFVQKAIAGTNGLMYKHLIRRLPRYPIPCLRLPQGNGRHFLDIGCSWGRWCIAAAREGYNVVGIDPSLDAITAANRVARQLGVKATYLVADATHLPFSKHTFDVVFSYSVLQHFKEDDVRKTLFEASRTLKPRGVLLVQMANTFGLRNLVNQIQRGFREPAGFEVRYWRIGELSRLFSEIIGPTSLEADGYFSLNAQASDIDLLPLGYRFVVSISEKLRALSQDRFWLTRLADSLYVRSFRKEK